MSDFLISGNVDTLIRAIYRGPLEESPWRSFLNSFCDAVDANYATLLLRPPREGDAGLVLNAVVASAEIYQSYNETYFALDPFVNLPAGKVVTLQEFMPRAELLETQYYQHYMAPIGVFHNMGVDMTEPDGLNARLRVTRPEGSDDFGKKEKALCQLLIPHLQQSIALHSRIKRTESESLLYSEAINQLALGTIILDDQAKILRTNKAAEHLLRHNDDLRVKDGRLQIVGRNDNIAFRELVEQVLDAHQRRVPSFVKAFRINRADGVNGLGLLVRPFPLVESSEGKTNPALAIFISDPSQRRVVPADILVDLYGFTPAESSLVLLLANGLTLDEASDELGVSRNTAKSHLSSVFSKTGVTRQTKLIQLILKSVAPFAN
jgi:DNA-binding CsgD family transcriptional regulator/PAS domain-containing protein